MSTTSRLAQRADRTKPTATALAPRSRLKRGTIGCANPIAKLDKPKLSSNGHAWRALAEGMVSAWLTISLASAGADVHGRRPSVRNYAGSGPHTRVYGQALTDGGTLHTLAYMTHVQFSLTVLPNMPQLGWLSSDDRDPVRAA